MPESDTTITRSPRAGQTHPEKDFPGSEPGWAEALSDWMEGLLDPPCRIAACNFDDQGLELHFWASDEAPWRTDELDDLVFQVETLTGEDVRVEFHQPDEPLDADLAADVIYP